MKKVASSLKDLPTTEVFNRIIDPNDPVDDVIADLLDHWSYDLYTRRPSPALLEGGALTPTDLDLACFLSALVQRGAVIVLPTYEARRVARVREGERVVSNKNRHGQILGLTSNKDAFSFSALVNDANVVTTDLKTGREQVGAPRNFMLVDLGGVWYPGWKRIEFAPSRKENDFLEDNHLWTEGMSEATSRVVYFDNFVHPNRWVSFYGQWYLLTKVLIARLRAEAAFLFQQCKQLEESGVKLPATGPDAEREWGATEEVGEARSEKVKAFHAEVEAEVPATFPFRDRTQAGLVAARRRLRKIRYTDVPALQFPARATELAFSNMAQSFMLLGDAEGKGIEAPPPEPFPAWVSGAAWEHGYKVKRTVWNRLVLGQRFPFAKGFALRYRVSWKSERVAA